MCDPAYLAWCQQHGIRVHGVEPALVTEGWRGVVATQVLSPGDVVMTVPEGLLMSAVSALRDPQLAGLLQQHQLSSHQVLSLHLLHEASKGPASLWHPYIQQLPRTYTTFINWTPEAIQALQLPHAQAAAAAAVAKGRQDWAAARPVLQQLGLDKKWCSWRAWQWASSTVSSRTMYHPVDPPCGCLTPLGDLHNYAPPPAPYTPDITQGVQALLQDVQGLLQEPAQHGHQQQQHPACEPCRHDAQLQQGTEGTSAPQLDIMLAAPQLDSRLAAVALQDSSAKDGVQHLQEPQAVSTAAGLQLSTAAPVPQQYRSNCHYPEAVSAQQHSTAAHGSGCSTVGNNTSVDRPRSSSSDNPPAAGSGIASPAAAAVAGMPCGAVAAAAVVLTPAGPVGSDPAVGCAGGPGAADGAEASTAGPAAAAEAGGAAAAEAVQEAASTISGDGFFDQDHGCYKTIARRSYQPGEQVFLCYGRHTNLELLDLYGFLLPHNPHDTALLPVELLQQHLLQALQQQQQQRRPHAVSRPWRRQQQKQQQKQREWGQQVCLEVAAADCWVHVTGQPSWQLLCALRCAAASPPEAKALGFKALNGDPISLSSECTALMVLAAACRTQLAALPTTAAEDGLLLQQLAESAAQPAEGLPGAAGPEAGHPQAGVGHPQAGASDAAGVRRPAEVVGCARDVCGCSCQGARSVEPPPVDTVMRQEGCRCGAECCCGGGGSSGRVPCVVAAAAQQQDRQAQVRGQEVEALMLAVSWRHTYKRALLACAEGCERALALVGPSCAWVDSLPG